MNNLKKIVLTLCIFALTITSIQITSVVNVQAQSDIENNVVITIGSTSSKLVGTGTRFRSSNKSVVKVAPNGQLKALACGKADVSYQYKKYGRTYKGYCSVLVKGKDTSTTKYGLDGNVYLLSQKSDKIADKSYKVDYLMGNKTVDSKKAFVRNVGETKFWVKIPGTKKPYTTIKIKTYNKNSNRKPSKASKLEVKNIRYNGDGQIDFTLVKNFTIKRSNSYVEPEVKFNAMLVDVTTGYVVGSDYDSVFMSTQKQTMDKTVNIHCSSQFEKLNPDHSYDVIVTALVTGYRYLPG